MNKESESIMRGQNILPLLSTGKAPNFKMSQFTKGKQLPVKQHPVSALEPKP